MKRRSVLKGVGAVSVLGTGIGAWFVRSHVNSREGRVFWRQIAVDTTEVQGSLIVMTESIENDGEDTRTVHPDYEGAFGPEAEAPKSLHEDLQQEYGADEPYYLVRYESHDCNDIPGDEGGGTIEVSRSEFNRLKIRSCVRRGP
ncbi:hypothetical protein HWV07_04755 [Natronomonas salina]|uniref:hypothetical protein n=1 Tax=Natronomonas salina TaxID=1710540 RepID=UPI0015B7401E|nr:hypothetical protein [Natronomonas salina]QLD88378.1 hypothetical protein HWV07_04755 [Natronomonas salina]